jgi:two-component SAPR family response regulator
MQISCIAIDDEPLALSKIEGFIKSVPSLDLLMTFDNAVEAMVWLKSNQADLIFLDIQMRQLTGIEFLEAARELCNKFDIQKPYWLPTNMEEYNKRSKTVFNMHNFMEEIDFDKFVIEELDIKE